MEFTAKVRTCLWFDDKCEEAVRFYVSLLPDSRVDNVIQYDQVGGPLVIEFTLAGAPCMAFNGGPVFTFNEAVSLSVLTEDQAETDGLWAALTADGGNESQCGWLKDRFGLSWQIVPKALPRLLASEDREAASRTFQAMLTMRKLDVAALEAAYRGEAEAS